MSFGLSSKEFFSGSVSTVGTVGAGCFLPRLEHNLTRSFEFDVRSALSVPGI